MLLLTGRTCGTSSRSWDPFTNDSGETVPGGSRFVVDVKPDGLPGDDRDQPIRKVEFDPELVAELRDVLATFGTPVRMAVTVSARNGSNGRGPSVRFRGQAVEVLTPDHAAV